MELEKISIKELKHMNSLGFIELMPYIHKNPIVRWLFWKRLEVAIQLARKSNMDKVLDFGAGSGIFMPTLSKNFKEVYSLDIETAALKHVKDRFHLNNVKIVEGKEGKLPFKDQFFDVVFATDVLEHLKDSTYIQKEFSRVLKKGGFLIVSGPTENSLYKISRRMIYWFWKKKEDHFSNIYEIMKKTDKIFKIEDVRVLPNSLIPGFKIYRAVNG